MFVLGLSATAAILLWLALWPHVRARRVTMAAEAPLSSED
jgi:hypothetical protein